jgi:hypothetical protein
MPQTLKIVQSSAWHIKWKKQTYAFVTKCRYANFRQAQKSLCKKERQHNWHIDMCIFEGWGKTYIWGLPWTHGKVVACWWYVMANAIPTQALVGSNKTCSTSNAKIKWSLGVRMSCKIKLHYLFSQKEGFKMQERGGSINTHNLFLLLLVRLINTKCNTVDWLLLTLISEEDFLLLPVMWV